jgi:hypothetical protein
MQRFRFRGLVSSCLVILSETMFSVTMSAVSRTETWFCFLTSEKWKFTVWDSNVGSLVCCLDDECLSWVIEERDNRSSISVSQTHKVHAVLTQLNRTQTFSLNWVLFLLPFNENITPAQTTTTTISTYSTQLHHIPEQWNKTDSKLVVQTLLAPNKQALKVAT